MARRPRPRAAGSPTRRRWRGSGFRAGGPVEGADFIALMEGRHPGSGRWLRPEGAGGGRGGGIDVTFSAPKSVSAVWALGDAWQREQIEQAHAGAVEQTIHYLREPVPRASPLQRPGRRRERQGRDRDRVPAHHRPRGLGAQAPDPQLHSQSSSPARSARTTGSWPSPRGRSFAPRGSSARSTAPRSPTSSAGGLRDRAWHRQGRPVLRDRRRPRELCERSRGRSREVARRRSASVPATAEHPSAASYATSRSRTAAPRS